MREIAKRFLEDQNFTKEEFEELLKGFENKEERAAFRRKQLFFVRNIMEIRFLQEGLLNLPITVKIIVITAESEGEIKMQFVTALQRRKFFRAAKRDTTLDSALLSFRGEKIPGLQMSEWWGLSGK